MESSPLTQQNAPDALHEPKVVQLYLYLFNLLVNEAGDDVVPSEGFWREFFLLPPDKERLSQILEPLTGNDVLSMQTQTSAFFQRAIVEAGSGSSPRNENALETLTAFLNAVLSKRYTNPSADIIDVLGGLDSIDKWVSDLVSGLETVIRQTSRPLFRAKAIETAIALVAGAYQTTLVSYFIHRDLFPAIMKIASSQSKYVISPIHRRPSIEEVDDDFESLVLLGLLANYEKFESQNPYQSRLDDFVNEEVMHRLARSMAVECRAIRGHYIAIQDDTPESWTISSTLSYVGLRALSPEPRSRKAPPTEDEMKERFGAMPPLEATIFLPIYSFVQANKLFATALITLPADAKAHESPLSSFISSTSYLAHHAYRSSRAMTYTLFALLTIRIMVEDATILKRLTSLDPELRHSFRLARQRAPFLPLCTGPRIPITAILDLTVDTISHNLRRRLDIPLYSLTLIIIHRITSNLANTKTRLVHHWTHVWAALLTLLRFTVTYAPDLLAQQQHTRHLNFKTSVAFPLASLLAQCLSRGDAFLPDPQSYDDLFYKLVEAGETILKFRDIYCSPPKAPQSQTGVEMNLSRAITALLSVSNHYEPLLGTRKHQSPAAVARVIKEGYETLNLNLDEAGNMVGTGDDFGGGIAGVGDGRVGGAGVGASGEGGRGVLERYREVEWKGELKRMVRVVVEDARGLGMR